MISGSFVDDLSAVEIKIDVDTGALTTTPARIAFRCDPKSCAFSPDVFGTDFSLVETAGGSEDAYQASSYVSQDFWTQIVEEEETEE